MENNNGRGIFYGVIGVATLIVAIIGATFAYFTATANSDVNTVTAGGAEVKLTWREEINGLHTDLIPVASNDLNFNKKVSSETNGCLDTNGNRICSVYEFTIGNPSTTTSQNIYASLKIAKNDFINKPETQQTNLRFAIFSGTASDVATKSTQTVDIADFTAPSAAVAAATPGTLVVKATPITGTTTIALNALNELLPIETERTYTIVLWIEEAGDAQNYDQKVSFTGGIFFTTENGETNKGITGVLSA